MDQVHTPTEGRKTQGQHQHKFPQTWIKFTHKLRAGNTRTASAQVSTAMDQVHTPPEGRKTQEQHQDKFPQTWMKFKHPLRAGKNIHVNPPTFTQYASRQPLHLA